MKLIKKLNEFKLLRFLRSKYKYLKNKFITKHIHKNLYYIPCNQNEKIRIAFICQLPNLWYNFHSLIKACNENTSLITTHVILSPCLHPMIGIKHMNEMREILISQNISFYNYQHYNIEDLKPHVVFIQMPYANVLPKELSIEKLQNNGSRICYIQYGNEMYGGLESLLNCYNLPFIQNAWKVFARSQKHLQAYGRYCDVGNHHVVLTGHPKVDNLIKKHPIKQEILDKINGRKVILWAPTYIDSKNPSWSSFLKYYQYMLDQFSNNSDLFLIIRPHPLLRNSLTEYSLLDNDKIIAFNEFVNNSNNMLFYEDADYYPLFTISSALIADVCSFLTTYIITGKPILYLEQSDGLNVNSEGAELIENLYQAVNSDDIGNFINMVRDNIDPLKDERLKLIEDHFYKTDGNAGLRIRDYLINELQNYHFNEPVKISIKQSNTNQSNTNQNFIYDYKNAYKNAKKQSLEQIVKDLNNIENALDLGCGDGFFTEILSTAVSDKISAYDISINHISNAITRSTQKNINKIDYNVLDFFKIVTKQKYCLLSLMDVTSLILNDIDLITFFNKVPFLLKENGFLLIIDTFSLATDNLDEMPQTNIYNNKNYTTRYRIDNDFLQFLSNINFSLHKTYEIEKSHNNLVSKAYLFQLK